MTVDYKTFVQNQMISVLNSFELESGKVLTSCPVAYKTWGTLNEQGDNCMVLCHALSGSCDVEDWWGPLLGPGKTFDTSKFFIFCGLACTLTQGNVLGSPYGTASPCTIDPATQKPYGPHFPLSTIRDDVRLHRRILDQLGVKKVRFCIGGSMGGMQVLEWAFFGTGYVENIVPIATSGRHSAWCISWGEAQRQSIYSDPKYLNGDYEMSDPPASGLSAARMTAMLTYRSRNSFESRFGRKMMPRKQINIATTEEEAIHNEGNKFRLPLGPAAPQSTANDDEEKEFSVYSAQSYLRYQGDKFINRFDANCYISITRKLDTHDVSSLGHDGFLLEFVKMRALISAFIRERAPDMYLTTAVSTDTEELVSKASMFGEAEGDLLLW
ncbi:homoserine O- acetyltransferase [Kappamyces sp. JEL0680]|nr:homoserine O- acetyltransferase [Kappamyces sp. JEL0680]